MATLHPDMTTIEAWAARYLSSTELADKLAPPPPPARFSHSRRITISQPATISQPGRPSVLCPQAVAPRLRGLGNPKKRAQLLHVFLHHELQAAELMCWALLKFSDAPEAFRRGLLSIALDEIRHLNLYRDRLAELGYEVGHFPVRDWFWERVAAEERTPLQFVAMLGIGFEGANLDHSARFATRFADLGDPRSADLQRRIGREEIAHVRFAVHWFQRFGGDLTFEGWRVALPAPLSPIVFRGPQLDVAGRQRAGLSAAFCAALASWTPPPPTPCPAASGT